MPWWGHGYNQVVRPAAYISLIIAISMAMSLGAPGNSCAQEMEDFQAVVESPVEAILDIDPGLQPYEASSSQLSEILSRPEFVLESLEPEQQEPWLERFLKWLSGLFNGIGLGGQKWPGYVLLLALLVAVSYLVAKLVWEYTSRQRSKEVATVADDVSLSTHDQLLDAAKEAAASGRYRDAIRLLFASTVKLFSFPTSTVMTNSQFARRVMRDFSAVSKPFDTMVVLFEDCWYGYSPAGKSEYSRAEALANDIKTALVGREP